MKNLKECGRWFVRLRNIRDSVLCFFVACAIIFQSCGNVVLAVGEPWWVTYATLEQDDDGRNVYVLSPNSGIGDVVNLPIEVPSGYWLQLEGLELAANGEQPLLEVRSGGKCVAVQCFFSDAAGAVDVVGDAVRVAHGGVFELYESVVRWSTQGVAHFGRAINNEGKCVIDTTYISAHSFLSGAALKNSSTGVATIQNWCEFHDCQSGVLPATAPGYQLTSTTTEPVAFNVKPASLPKRQHHNIGAKVLKRFGGNRRIGAVEGTEPAGDGEGPDEAGEVLDERSPDELGLDEDVDGPAAEVAEEEAVPEIAAPEVKTTIIAATDMRNTAGGAICNNGFLTFCTSPAGGLPDPARTRGAQYGGGQPREFLIHVYSQIKAGQPPLEGNVPARPDLVGGARDMRYPPFELIVYDSYVSGSMWARGAPARLKLEAGAALFTDCFSGLGGAIYNSGSIVAENLYFGEGNAAVLGGNQISNAGDITFKGANWVVAGRQMDPSKKTSDIDLPGSIHVAGQGVLHFGNEENHSPLVLFGSSTQADNKMPGHARYPFGIGDRIIETGFGATLALDAPVQLWHLPDVVLNSNGVATSERGNAVSQDSLVPYFGSQAKIPFMKTFQPIGSYTLDAFTADGQRIGLGSWTLEKTNPPQGEAPPETVVQQALSWFAALGDGAWKTLSSVVTDHGIAESSTNTENPLDILRNQPAWDSNQAKSVLAPFVQTLQGLTLTDVLKQAQAMGVGDLFRSLVRRSKPLAAVAANSHFAGAPASRRVGAAVGNRFAPAGCARGLAKKSNGLRSGRFIAAGGGHFAGTPRRIIGAPEVVVGKAANDQQKEKPNEKVDYYKVPFPVPSGCYTFAFRDAAGNTVGTFPGAVDTEPPVVLVQQVQGATPLFGDTYTLNEPVAKAEIVVSDNSGSVRSISVNGPDGVVLTARRDPENPTCIVCEAQGFSVGTYTVNAVDALGNSVSRQLIFRNPDDPIPASTTFLSYDDSAILSSSGTDYDVNYSTASTFSSDGPVVATQGRTAEPVPTPAVDLVAVETLTGEKELLKDGELDFAELANHDLGGAAVDALENGRPDDLAIRTVSTGEGQDGASGIEVPVRSLVEALQELTKEQLVDLLFSQEDEEALHWTGEDLEEVVELLLWLTRGNREIEEPAALVPEGPRELAELEEIAEPPTEGVDITQTATPAPQTSELPAQETVETKQQVPAVTAGVAASVFSSAQPKQVIRKSTVGKMIGANASRKGALLTNGRQKKSRHIGANDEVAAVAASPAGAEERKTLTSDQHAAAAAMINGLVRRQGKVAMDTDMSNTHPVVRELRSKYPFLSGLDCQMVGLDAPPGAAIISELPIVCAARVDAICAQLKINLPVIVFKVDNKTGKITGVVPDAVSNAGEVRFKTKGMGESHVLVEGPIFSLAPDGVCAPMHWLLHVDGAALRASCPRSGGVVVNGEDTLALLSADQVRRSAADGPISLDVVREDAAKYELNPKKCLIFNLDGLAQLGADAVLMYDVDRDDDALDPSAETATVYFVNAHGQRVRF
ncbi:MAG: hypothetical protein LBJ38_01495, partial [Oscillospiraceae bacterium]|nr:hypothetical protein [Oscillospiraceae bacterium]